MFLPQILLSKLNAKRDSENEKRLLMEENDCQAFITRQNAVCSDDDSFYALLPSQSQDGSNKCENKHTKLFRARASRTTRNDSLR